MRASLAPYLNRLSPLWARSSIIASALKGTPLGAMVGSARGAVTIIECLIVVACAHQVSRLFWTLVTPDAISSATSSSGSERTVQTIQLPRNLIITRVDLFRSATNENTAGSATVVAPATALNLQLFGLRSGGADGRDSAIIRRPDNSQDVFFIGQEIIDGVVLEKIQSDHVVIRRMGVIEGLYLDQARAAISTIEKSPAQTATSNETQSSEPLRRRISISPTELFAALEAVPVTAASGKQGLRLQPRGDIAIFQDAGFISGDVLLSVNGQAVTDLARMPSLIESLASVRSFTVEFDRSGQKISQRLVVDR